VDRREEANGVDCHSEEQAEQLTGKPRHFRWLNHSGEDEASLSSDPNGWLETQVLFGVGGFALKNNNDLAKLNQETWSLLI
jgi:hypothetical protein